MIFLNSPVLRSGLLRRVDRFARPEPVRAGKAELRSLLVFGSCEIVSSFNGMGVILRLLARNKGTQREVFERDAT